jgi:hydrogenase maturation protein HypF
MAKLHATLAELLLARARAVRAERGVSALGLTGGVFQNRVMCERFVVAARRDGFTVHIPESCPATTPGSASASSSKGARA